jgi:DNA-binding NarL/FixJ family response regulator
MRAYPQAALVLFAGNVSAEMQMQALRLGVAGYLEQSLPLARFITALRAIYCGQRVLGMGTNTTSVPGRPTNQIRRAYECQRRDLNETDIELVRLAADGFSNKEIAALQLLSELHVKRRMQDIYRKLRVIDRAQAVTVATHIGLI